MSLCKNGQIMVYRVYFFLSISRIYYTIWYYVIYKNIHTYTYIFIYICTVPKKSTAFYKKLTLTKHICLWCRIIILVATSTSKQIYYTRTRTDFEYNVLFQLWNQKWVLNHTKSVKLTKKYVMKRILTHRQR